MVRRVRGLACTMRVSPQFANSMVTASKGLLLGLLADVTVATDHMRGAEAGGSRGFGITLVAETTSGCRIGAESVVSAQVGFV